MIDRPDRLAIFSLLWCGTLLGLRWACFYPATTDRMFELDFLLSGTTLLFFGWNLFLAALPYGFARLARQTSNRLLLAGLGVLWLAFLPNAPYVVSDLIHLRPRPEVPYGFDVLVFVSCAATGLLLGALSVIAAAGRVAWAKWPAALRVVSLLLFPLCGFGIYLGRVLRWNSWDIVAQPFALLRGLLDLFTNFQSLLMVSLYCVLYGLLLALTTAILWRTRLWCGNTDQ